MMRGSRVRVPPFPPAFSATCGLPADRTMESAGDLREARSQTLSALSNQIADVGRGVMRRDVRCLVSEQSLAVLERHAGRMEPIPEGVLEVVYPDGPESSGQGDPSSSSHRAAARLRAAFHPELFVLNCGCRVSSRSCVVNTKSSCSPRQPSMTDLAMRFSALCKADAELGNLPRSACTCSRVAHRGSCRSRRNSGTFGTDSSVSQSVTQRLRGLRLN